MRVAGQGSQVWLIGILWAVQVTGQEFTISTIAGGVPPPTPAVATAASIGRPVGIAVDAAGNVYFSSVSNAVFKLDTAGILTLMAGNSRWGYSGDGGPATSAQFRYPWGVALDGAGNLYIADSNNNCVRRVSPSGIITTVAGNGTAGLSGDGGPATSAQLNYPSGVAVDGAGNLYVADANNSRIRRVSSSGIITTVPGTEGSAGQAFLSGIAVDGAGNLYYSDWDNLLVRRVSSSGTITTVALPSNLHPNSVAVDRWGNLYISDGLNCRISRQIGPGIVTTVAGTGTMGYSGDGGIATSARLSQPSGVAVDGAGNVYITDSNNNRVRRVASSGSGMVYTGIISTVAGDGTDDYSGDGGPAISAQMSPSGVAVDAAGNLYIADGSTDRIRRVSPAGIITTVAGNGITGYSGDGGPATSAQLRQPWGVAVDGAGNLYFADYGNHRVRRVSLSGIITTVAGTGVYGFSGDGGPATSAKIDVDSVTVDGSGNLYISDWTQNRIRRVSPSGIITTVAGNGVEGYSGDGGPATSAQLNEPRGVAVDQVGNLYIADSSNHRVRRVSLTGIITTVAGKGTAGFSGDGGAATSAQLNGPMDVGVDGAGNLYITDLVNHRIRRVSSSGIISTVAGDGTDQYSGDGGPATSAQLYYPFRLALDSAGRVYLTTWNAVRMLTPVCTMSATPTALTAPGIGGTLTLTIQATPGCGWTITNLPAWITASAAAGSGPATVTLTVAGNPGTARSATITAAGTAVIISQGTAGGPLGVNCTSADGPSRAGVAYSVECTAIGGMAPYSWSIGPGALPAGLILSANTGTSVSIKGTPTTAGGYDFTVTVTDIVTRRASQRFSGTIAAAPVLTLSCVPGVGPSVVGLACLETCTAAGGIPPYRWSISQGALPNGLALSATTGATISISGTPSADGKYAFTVSVTDGATPPQNATKSFSGTLPIQQFRVHNAASYQRGILAPDSIASIFGGGLALRTESYDGSVVTILGGATVRVTDSKGVGRDAQMFYASSGQINFLVPAGTATGVAGIMVNKPGIIGVLFGSVMVADVAPGIFVVSGGSTVPAAFYLRVTPANERIQDYTFNPTTLEAVNIPRNSGDAIYLLLYGTGFRRHRGSVTATANGQTVPVIGAVAQSQFAGLDQVNIGPLPANLASGIVTVHLDFDGLPANDITVRLQ